MRTGIGGMSINLVSAFERYMAWEYMSEEFRCRLSYER
jgi:hypothetical protein